LVRYVSKVAPSPQVFTQTARWHSTLAELLRNLVNQRVLYRCWAFTMLFLATMMAWLNTLDFSFCGYVKHKVFVPLLSASLEEPWSQTTEAVATIDADVINRIWDEIA